MQMLNGICVAIALGAGVEVHLARAEGAHVFEGAANQFDLVGGGFGGDGEGGNDAVVFPKRLGSDDFSFDDGVGQRGLLTCRKRNDVRMHRMEGVVMGEGVGEVLCARNGARSKEENDEQVAHERGVLPCK